MHFRCFKGIAMRKFPRLIRLKATRRRRAALRMARKVLRDESGGEVLEYALVAGLIVVGVISTVSCVGMKVLARWNAVNSKV